MKYEWVDQAKNYLLDRMGGVPHIAIIMGSGVSAVDELLRDITRTHYITIPHFPVPKVAGHRGQAIFGRAESLNVIVFEGRVHYYEGNAMDEVTFCTRVIGQMGVETLLLTNAAAAVNPSFARGQLMLISDHINLLGANPLCGPNEDRWGPRFVDQTEVYSMDLREQLRTAAKECDIEIAEGVYAALTGPTYETPAEVRYLRTIGADAAGMSTVPEAIVARHMGLRVGGVSMLSNLAAAVGGGRIDHSDVLDMTAQMNADLGLLLHRFFSRYKPGTPAR